MAAEFASVMAGAASAHQAATSTREDTSQQRAGRTRRTSADPQRAQQGATASPASAPAALDSLSRLQHLADASPQVAELRRLQALADGQFAPVAQLAGGPEEEELVQGKFATAELQPQLQQAPRANNTGLPDQLKSGIESLSGLSMDHVRVHYNSSQPAQLNALAYAQGSDIHLASGQEKHLPHEAWHVVQQAQGRVQPTLQIKDGVQVNDDVGLEREADMMGERARRSGESVQENTQQTLDKNISGGNTAAVAQRRIPEMNLEFITANKPMAVDILMHAMDNMEIKEFMALNAATSNRLRWDYNEIVAALGQGSPEDVYEWYQLIYEKSGEEKRYASTLNDQDSLEAKDLQTNLVNKQVDSKVLPTLAKLHQDVKLHQLIFGPTCNSSEIQEKLNAIYEELHKHITNKTCPMVMDGNKEHNEWVGVAGSTINGASKITIGKAGFKGVLDGTPRGLATLVHEFSHAKAKTIDLAYSISSLANLTTLERVTNAETYAQAFLEVIAGADPARHYDKDKITDTAKGHAKSEANLKTRLSGINKLIINLWNNVDNTYASVKILVTLQNLPAEARHKMSQAIYAATFPHRPALAAHPDITMALIEDRAKVLYKYLSRGNVAKSLRSHKVTKAQMETPIKGDGMIDYINMAAIAMQDDLHMGVESTLKFIENAIQISEFNKEAMAIVKNYENNEKAKSLLHLIVTESAKVSKILDTGNKASHITLSRLIEQYKLTGVNPQAIAPYSKVLTQAIGRSIQKL